MAAFLFNYGHFQLTMEIGLSTQLNFGPTLLKLFVLRLVALAATEICPVFILGIWNYMWVEIQHLRFIRVEWMSEISRSAKTALWIVILLL